MTSLVASTVPCPIYSSSKLATVVVSSSGVSSIVGLGLVPSSEGGDKKDQCLLSF